MPVAEADLLVPALPPEAVALAAAAGVTLAAPVVAVVILDPAVHVVGREMKVVVVFVRDCILDTDVVDVVTVGVEM